MDPSECNPIIYVTERDIASKKQLDELRDMNGLLVSGYESAQREKAAAVRAETEFREATALNIKTNVGD